MSTTLYSPYNYPTQFWPATSPNSPNVSQLLAGNFVTVPPPGFPGLTYPSLSFFPDATPDLGQLTIGVSFRLASANGFNNGFNLDTIPFSFLPFPASGLPWNNENSWNTVVAVGWQASWQAGNVARFGGAMTPGDGPDFGAFLRSGNSEKYNRATISSNPFWLNPGGAGPPGFVPLFSDLPVKQLLVGINAAAIPTAFPSNYWAEGSTAGLGYSNTRIPQFYIAYGVQIVEFDDFTKPNPAPLAVAPYFYPGDNQLTSFAGTGFSQAGFGGSLPVFGESAAGGSPYFFLYNQPPPDDNPNNVNNNGPIFLSQPLFSGLFTNQAPSYVIPPVLPANPGVQRPNLLAAFPPASVSASSVTGHYSGPFVGTGFLPMSGFPYFIQVPNGHFVPNGLTSVPPVFNPNGLPGPFGVMGNYTAPVIKVPMNDPVTGKPKYYLYLG